MSSNELTADEQRFYLLFDQHFSDELSKKDFQWFSQTLKDPKQQKNLQAYKDNLGKLQLSLSNIQLSAQELAEIDYISGDPKTQKNLEEVQITQLDNSLHNSDRLRSVLLFSIAITIVLMISNYLTPKTKDKFDALDSLGYESIAMEQDTSGERLLMPTNDPEEIDSYFKGDPSLSFSPQQLHPVPKDWLVEGAAIIDYEITKLTVVQYKYRLKPYRLFVYTLSRPDISLPQANDFKKGEITFGAYANNKVNMLSWPIDNQTIAIAVSRISLKQMAEIISRASTHTQP